MNFDKFRDNLYHFELLPDFLFDISRGPCSYADSLDEERCAINTDTVVTNTEIQQLRF